jgi:outer membrane protein
MKKNLLTFLAVSLFFCSGIAQETWTLQRCINHALENNIQLKQIEINSRIAKNSLNSSRAAFLPNLNVGGSNDFNFGRSVDPFTNDFSEEKVRSNNFYAQSGITLFSGFQQLNSVFRDSYSLKASLQDVEKARNDLSLNIASSYLQILFNEELLKIAQNQLEISKMQIEKAMVMVELGKMAKGGLLEIQSQAAIEDMRVTNAQNQFDLSILALTQLLDLPTVDNFAIAHPNLDMISGESVLLSTGQLFMIAENIMPELKAAGYRLKSQEKTLAIARGGTSPTLTLFATYATGYSDARQQLDINSTHDVEYGYVGTTHDKVYITTYGSQEYKFEDQINDNTNKSLSFRLTIPVFNGLQNYHNISNAKLGVINSKYDYELTKNNLYQEIQQALADAKAALSNYESTTKNVSSVEKAFEYTQQKFDVGLVDPIDYNTSKTQLTKAQSDLLQSKYEYILRLKVLDFYRGNPITL